MARCDVLCDAFNASRIERRAFGGRDSGSRRRHEDTRISGWLVVRYMQRKRETNGCELHGLSHGRQYSLE